MIEFRDIVLSDKEWMDEILSKSHNMSCEYCFGNHYIWKNAYQIQVARIYDDYVLLLVGDEGDRGRSFLYPAGVSNKKLVFEELLDYCSQNNIKFKMHSASKEQVDEIEAIFPNKFEFSSDRDYCDYIYTVENLTNLKGKKYHGKRNHIARFKEHEWSFEPITQENMNDCIAMNDEWCKINDCGRDQSLKDECCAIKKSFKYFNELDFFGGLLRMDGNVVAYTIAEQLNEDSVAVHMEKAFSDIQGAYPTINREFVANMCQQYKYVNREEDLGFEGLRKAKLSYLPTIVLDKYNIKLK